MNRFDYVKYDEMSVKMQETFKAMMVSLEEGLQTLTDSRYKSLALTSLEEFYCWIGKAIRDDQIKRNGSAPLQEERSNS